MRSADAGSPSFRRTLRRYRRALAHGMLVQKFLETLKRVGLVVEPYYFYRESARQSAARLAAPGIEGLEFSEAVREDADGIAAMNPGRGSAGENRSEFDRGRRCFALRRGGTIVAVSWCDEREILFPPCRRPLAPNEAYLFRMETHPDLRGHDLAPFLRARCLAALAESGRDAVFSYTDFFNRPAVRFKEKIGARILFLGLHLKFFGLPSANFILRNSSEDAAPARPAGPLPPG